MIVLGHLLSWLEKQCIGHIKLFPFELAHAAVISARDCCSKICKARSYFCKWKIDRLYFFPDEKCFCSLSEIIFDNFCDSLTSLHSFVLMVL